MQTTSTELLKSYVLNEPIVIDAARVPSLGPAAIFMVLMSMVNQILVASFVLPSSLNMVLWTIATHLSAAREQKNARDSCH